MAQRFICGNCGGKATVPPGYAKAKVRCEHCGYYAEVPPDMRAKPDAVPEPETPFDIPATVVTKPAVRARVAPVFDDESESTRSGRAPAIVAQPYRDPHDHRPEFAEETGVGAPLLAGDQIEHDGALTTPYEVPGNGLKPCPKCRDDLPLDAAFCVHCGWELVGKRKLKSKREFEEIDKIWYEGWNPATRLQIFITLQFVNVLLIALGMLANGQSFKDASAIGMNVMMNLFNMALQAFILGSFESLHVTRDPKGRCVIVKVRRYCFIPMPGFKIPLNKSAGVGIVASHNPGMVSYVICIYLLFMGCLPGILFFIFVIRPESFHAALCNEFGGTEETLLLCKNRQHAEEVTRNIAGARGIRWHNIL